MHKFLNILKKEIKDLLTLRMILPFIMSIFLLFFIGNIMQGEIGRGIKPLNIGIMDLDRTPSSNYLIESLKSGGHIITMMERVDDSVAIKSGQKENLSIVIIVPEGFGDRLKNKRVSEIKLYSIITSLGITTSIQSAGIRTLLRYLNQEVSGIYAKELDPQLDPEFFKEPIKVQEFVVLRDLIQSGSAAFIIGYISNQTVIVPVALLMLIIITGTMIASSIAQEKENKTLETLLTVPVSRLTIVLAKMLAAVILALVFALFFVFAMGSFMGSLGGAGNIPTDIQFQGSRINIAIDTNGKILLGLSIFLSIVAALCSATLLALFARDVKDAQTTIMPLTIMILIPYLFALIFDPNTMSPGLKLFTFLIPFSHTFFAFKFLLLGQTLPVILGNIYLLIFSLFLFFLATKIFSSERILTMKFSLKKLKLSN